MHREDAKYLKNKPNKNIHHPSGEKIKFPVWANYICEEKKTSKGEKVWQTQMI